VFRLHRHLRAGEIDRCEIPVRMQVYKVIRR
jgi:hypothetical protein